MTDFLNPRWLGDVEFIIKDSIALVKEPGFNPRIFATHLEGFTPEELIKCYQSSIRWAKGAAYQCDLQALAVFQELTKALAGHPLVARQLEAEPQVMEDIYLRAVQRGYDQNWNEARSAAQRGAIEEAEALQEKVEACGRHPDYSRRLRLTDVLVLPYPKDILPQVISYFFDQAEHELQQSRTDKAHTDKAIKFLNKASEYTRLAGIPFNEKRYREVLYGDQG
jgi:hypothetical protein